MLALSTLEILENSPCWSLQRYMFVPQLSSSFLGLSLCFGFPVSVVKANSISMFVKKSPCNRLSKQQLIQVQVLYLNQIQLMILTKGNLISAKQKSS